MSNVRTRCTAGFWTKWSLSSRWRAINANALFCFNRACQCLWLIDFPHTACRTGRIKDDGRSGAHRLFDALRACRPGAPCLVCPDKELKGALAARKVFHVLHHVDQRLPVEDTAFSQRTAALWTCVFVKQPPHLHMGQCTASALVTMDASR